MPESAAAPDGFDLTLLASHLASQLICVARTGGSIARTESRDHGGPPPMQTCFVRLLAELVLRDCRTDALPRASVQAVSSYCYVRCPPAA